MVEHVAGGDGADAGLAGQGIEGGQATFGVRYSMDCFRRDGSVERERNTNECYKVRRLPGEDRWVIVRNDDYQQRICYR